MVGVGSCDVAGVDTGEGEGLRGTSGERFQGDSPSSGCALADKGDDDDGGLPNARILAAGVGGVRIRGTGVCFAANARVLGAEICGGVVLIEGFLFGFGMDIIGTVGIRRGKVVFVGGGASEDALLLVVVVLVVEMVSREGFGTRMGELVCGSCLRPKVASKSVLGVRMDSASLNAFGITFGESGGGAGMLGGSNDNIDAVLLTGSMDGRSLGTGVSARDSSTRRLVVLFANISAIFNCIGGSEGTGGTSGVTSGTLAFLRDLLFKRKNLFRFLTEDSERYAPSESSPVVGDVMAAALAAFSFFFRPNAMEMYPPSDSPSVTVLSVVSLSFLLFLSFFFLLSEISER